MKITLTQLFCAVSFVQIFAFCIFLIRNIQKCRPNIYLVFFFIAQLILVGRQLFGYFFGSMVQNYLFILCTPVFWFVVPSVLLYIQSILLGDFKFKKQYFLHFIPALIVIIFCFFSALKLYMTNHGYSIINDFVNDQLMWKFLFYLMYVYFLIYTLIGIGIIRKYQQTEIIRTQKADKNLSWLKIFVNGFFISWLINAIIVYAYQLDWLPEIFSAAPFILIFPFFIFFNIVFYLAWENPQPFIVNTFGNKDFSQEINQLKLAKLEKLLLNFMEIEKPYLNPDLSINKLSDQLGIPAKHLSKIINTNLEQNFNDFINYYRTKEVTKTLTNVDKLDTDLVSLGLDCGFNSKASFFRVFKKNIGLTPRQFFDNMQNKQPNIITEGVF